MSRKRAARLRAMGCRLAHLVHTLFQITEILRDKVYFLASCALTWHARIRFLLRLETESLLNDV